MSARPVFFDFVKTPFGTFQIAATEQGLVAINFPNRSVSVPNYQRAPARARRALEVSKLFLRNFFSGRHPQSKRIPIDWRLFTPFDQRVLQTLRKIPPRITISYSTLAKRARVPRAVRAVGNALNRNPVPILIPCHRVIRKNRTLGGYRGGFRWKQTLLNLEKKQE